MNTTTRYILTATAVGAGLLTVGATANAIASGGTSADSIGTPVVLPSSDPVALPSTSPEEVDIPGAADLDDLSPSPTGVLDTGGWATAPAGSGGGDDEGVEDDHSAGDDSEGVEIENEGADD